MAKYTGWQNLPTPQSKELLSELMEAKENNQAKLLICDTGMGKTNTVKLFAKTKPDHTYVVTVGDTYRLIDVLNDINTQLGIRHYQYADGKGKTSALRAITKKITEIAEEGNNPIIIIDEAENSRGSLLKAYKQLYDYISGKCAIVLIGTTQITIAMSRKYEGQSMPQLRRRFKAGTRYITPLNKPKHFKPFFELYIPQCTGVQEILFDIADNYGELHDYLEPVLLHCQKKGIEITTEEFCRFHKLPIPQKLLNNKTKPS